ncbi:MAG TPA: hypothetical protein PLV92_27210 [Pirellulaceae bacterium]|nr:hypothetical protein [Pirellulaceae bacterium]
MTRLADATLQQLTTAFATSARAECRVRYEPSTIQLVYVALAELRERRRLDDLVAAAVGVVDARAATHDGRNLLRLAIFESGDKCTGMHGKAGSCFQYRPERPCPTCQPIIDAIEGRRILSHHQKGAVRTLANTVARLRAAGVDLTPYRLAPRKGREDKRRKRAREARAGAERLATPPKG